MPAQAQRTQRRLQLLCVNLPIAVRIEQVERLAQLLQLLRVQLCDGLLRRAALAARNRRRTQPPRSGRPRQAPHATTTAAAAASQAFAHLQRCAHEDRGG
jgi:hypothetical protein